MLNKKTELIVYGARDIITIYYEKKLHSVYY